MIKDDVDNLIRKSKKFLATARYHYNNEDYDLAAFSLEQSLQLFIKAKLLEYGINYPHTHSLFKLLSILADITDNDRIVELSKTYSLEIAHLEDAYILARYSSREYKKDEVSRLFNAVEEVIKAIEQG